jgi:16S rRNA (uracil1498-N3)-methyltransferase
VASLYLATDLPPDVVAGSVVTLDGDEGRHAITVARVRVGETLSISDGAGLIVSGAVVSIDGTVLTLEVATAQRHPAPVPELWLAQALAKGDRDELAVQAATELGVSGVIPWAAERSITRWEGPKADKGRVRWASIVREATKQSIRPYVPAVEAISTTASLAKRPGLVLVLEPTASTRLTEVALDADQITLVVGPEGGVSPRELDVLGAAGAVAVRLGAEVLRTSTAGPAALAVLNARLGRW